MECDVVKNFLTSLFPKPVRNIAGNVLGTVIHGDVSVSKEDWNENDNGSLLAKEYFNESCLGYQSG